MKIVRIIEALVKGIFGDFLRKLLTNACLYVIILTLICLCGLVKQTKSDVIYEFSV